MPDPRADVKAGRQRRNADLIGALNPGDLPQSRLKAKVIAPTILWPRDGAAAT